MRVTSFIFNAVFAVVMLLTVFAAIGKLQAHRPEASAKMQTGPGTKKRIRQRIAQSAPAQPLTSAAHDGETPALQPASAPAASGSDAAPASVTPPAITSFHTDVIPSAPVPLPAALPKPAPASALKKANARDLFGAVKAPANLAAKSIGFYAKGCLSGGKPLPVNGPAWQVMRLSRNRNWGHPSLIKFIERFAQDAKEKDGWPGLLIGDLSMPRGGPMPFGHASHQVGLDVDIWYKPEPDRELSPQEREDIKMESFLSDPAHVNPEVWKPEYEQLLRRAVSYPEVTRIFVHPAIKKWLCETVKGDRKFLHKITPIMGHNDHFHVRLACPADNPSCQNQPPIPTDEGCGKGLDNWLAALSKPVPAAPAAVAGSPPKPAANSVANKKPAFPMGSLPAECEKVLKAEPAVVFPVVAAH